MLVQGIIMSVSQEETKNGKPYCKVNLLTPSKVQVNVWGCKTNQFIQGKLFGADVKSDDLGMSCSFSDVSFRMPTEEQVSWIPKPPTIEEWNSVIQFLAELMKKQGTLEEKVDWFVGQANRLYTAYCEFPAGKSNHHAYKGGLARHTYEILNMYLHVYESLPYSTNVFVTALSALFHDAAKIRCYKPDTFEYTQYGVMVNHVAGSASMLSTLMTGTDIFNDDEIMYCEHCILAHHELLEYGSPVKPACVEALVLAMLDRISGHGTQMAENATEQGTRINNLGTTIYKLTVTN